MKKKICLVLVVLLTLSIIGGCSGKSSKTSQKQKDVTLKFLLLDDFQYGYFTETTDLDHVYNGVKSNVHIEFELAKDSEQYAEILKIRNSADELPDLMTLKPYMLSKFKDVMSPLTDLQAVKNNIFASQFAIDDTVVGIPERSFGEFIYFRKSLFEKYKLEVPTTWDDFIQVASAIRDKNEYIPLILGGKDAWPVYPFNEFMPSLEASDGYLWNTMATQDAPFSQGEPFHEAYAKIQQLVDAKVCGDDPLGIGFDQAKAMFLAGEGAMLAAGQWYFPDYKDNGGNMDDLGVFLLPTRHSKSDPFNTIAMVDNFIATPKGYENEAESKAFIEWYFASDYYKDYIHATGNNATVEGVKSDNPLFKEAYDRVDVHYIVYDGGNEDFYKIGDSFGFDVKKIGQEMLAGKDFDTLMKELNDSWAKGRKKLD